MARNLARVALLGVLLAGAAPAPAQDQAISVGVRTLVHSEVLGEDRQILISTPAGYERSRTARYPVVYVLDGGAFFLQAVADTRFLAAQGMAPETIVVAIPSMATRTRDLTPLTTTASDREENPTAGGADTFRRFMVTELRPFIAGRYRAEPYSILIGWSFGGLFAVHSLLADPDSFDAYVAVSPSLWWNGEAEAAAAERIFTPGAKLKKFLYITHGREYNGIPKSVQWFTRTLGRKAPDSLRWTFAYLPDDNHSSSPARAIYDGLEKLFEGWALPEDRGIPALAEIEEHYAALGDRFSFPCRPDEGRINGMGYALLQRKAIDEAVAMFEYNARLHPESPNVYDSLAEAQEAAGKPALAAELCRKACALAEEQGDERLETFRKHRDAVEKKVAGGK